MGYKVEIFVEKPSQHFTCYICQEVMQNPTFCVKCQQSACLNCINRALQQDKRCPQCRVINPQLGSYRTFQQLIDELKIKCEKQECSKIMELRHYQNHIQKECQALWKTCQNCQKIIPKSDNHNCYLQVKQELEKLKEQVQQYSLKIKQQDEQIKQFQKQNSNLITENQKLQKEIQEQDETIQLQKSQIEQNSQNLSFQTTQLNQFQQKLSESELKQQNLQNELFQINQENQKLKQLNQQIQTEANKKDTQIFNQSNTIKKNIQIINELKAQRLCLQSNQFAMSQQINQQDKNINKETQKIFSNSQNIPDLINEFKVINQDQFSKQNLQRNLPTNIQNNYLNILEGQQSNLGTKGISSSQSIQIETQAEKEEDSYD